MLLAGTDTTANALVVGTWSVLRDAQVQERLGKELREALAGPDSEITAAKLEKLPYLVSLLQQNCLLNINSFAGGRY